MTDNTEIKIAQMEAKLEAANERADERHGDIVGILKELKDTVKKIDVFQVEVNNQNYRINAQDIEIKDHGGRLTVLEQDNATKKSVFDNIKILNRVLITFLVTVVLGGSSYSFYVLKNKSDNTAVMQKALDRQAKVSEQLLKHLERQD